MKLNAKARLLALQDMKTIGHKVLEVLVDTFETAGFELTRHDPQEIRSSGHLTDGMFKLAGRDLNKLMFSHLGYKVEDRGKSIKWTKHGEPIWFMVHVGGKVHVYEQGDD